MPEAAAPVIAAWIHKTGCLFKITKSRKTKFGDYRAPYAGQGHRISVNHDLNPYAFLITAIHEFAHLKTWEEYDFKIKPHGAEWKHNFRGLMRPFLTRDIFPPDLKNILEAHMDNPAASSCVDPGLYKSLQKYNLQQKATCFVEDLEPNADFVAQNGKVFTKREKVRTRYRCQDRKTGLIYLFPALAEVYPNVENS